MRRLMYKLASKFLVFEQNKALTEEVTRYGDCICIYKYLSVCFL
jgi:hypothetical protein